MCSFILYKFSSVLSSNLCQQFFYFFYCAWEVQEPFIIYSHKRSYLACCQMSCKLRIVLNIKAVPFCLKWSTGQNGDVQTLGVKINVSRRAVQQQLNDKLQSQTHCNDCSLSFCQFSPPQIGTLHCCIALLRESVLYKRCIFFFAFSSVANVLLFRVYCPQSASS